MLTKELSLKMVDQMTIKKDKQTEITSVIKSLDRSLEIIFKTIIKISKLKNKTAAPLFQLQIGNLRHLKEISTIPWSIKHPAFRIQEIICSQWTRNCKDQNSTMSLADGVTLAGNMWWRILLIKASSKILIAKISLVFNLQNLFSYLLWKMESRISHLI